MRLLLLLVLVGSALAGIMRDRRQSGGTGGTISFFNQTFPGPPGVPQGTIDQFQGAVNQGTGFFPQPPTGFIPQPPQGFIPQPPQGFIPQPPTGAIPQPPQGFFPQPPQGFFPPAASGFFPAFPGSPPAQGGGTPPAGGEQPAGTSSDVLVGRKEPQPQVIPIIRYEFSPSSADGSYKFSYESGDGTKREESGSQKSVGDPAESGTVAQGSYSYTAPDGNLVQVSYTADERGFIPTGSHIPQPSREILSGLEASAASQAAQNGGAISPAYHYFFRNAYRRHY